ncbi:hypothetical protein ACFU5Y_18560 [Streptomyces gardneri]|uniref:hypothetical protein n=1 Tax=Streptomyces gardneri TaxID=66892 RepID=UPI00369698BB
MTLTPIASTDPSDPLGRQEPPVEPATTAPTPSEPTSSSASATERTPAAAAGTTAVAVGDFAVPGPRSTSAAPGQQPESDSQPEPEPEPEQEPAPQPQPEPEPHAQPEPEQDAHPTPEPDPTPEPTPEPAPTPTPSPESEPLRPATGRTAPGPRVRAVLVDPPAGARGQSGAETPPEPGTRPRLGAVPATEPTRADAASRRRSVPTVRAVRLTAEPAAPSRRPAPAPAAVTPVPLPLPTPRPVTDDVPPESRTEEPQP